MITYANEALFLQDSIAKALSITGTGISITNSNMNGESFSLEEILNSGREIEFGECNAAKLSFSCGYYDTSIVGKELTAKTTPDGGAAFQFGKYKVVSDEPTADRRWRDIIAYDALYDVLKKDVTSWYNTILPDADASVTLAQFRNSFFTMLGITQETITLPNDSMTVTRTVDPTVISGKTVITAICQINGCFGRIGRDGKFQYVFLAVPAEGLFPSETLYPSDNLYPREYGFENEEKYENGTYFSCKYMDFLTQTIDKLQICTSKNAVGATVGTGNNVYVIKDNFLVFDKTAAELEIIATNIFSQISGVWYRPCQIEAVGNPCLECGDGIRLKTTDNKDIDTIILKRKIKGIQSLKDLIIADGLKQRENDPNSAQEQIVQIKGNVRKVEADIVETNLLIAQEIQADRARIGDLEADHVSVAQLNAVDAKFQNLNADNITAGTLSVDRLNINALILSFSGKTIGASEFVGGTVKVVNYLQLRDSNTGTYKTCFMNTLTISGTTFNYVGWS